MREPLEDICKRVAERFESLDCDEKRLGLEALDVTAIVTDVQVEINYSSRRERTRFTTNHH